MTRAPVAATPASSGIRLSLHPGVPCSANTGNPSGCPHCSKHKIAAIGRAHDFSGHAIDRTAARQQLRHRLGGSRATEQESLRAVAAELDQPRPLGFGLDALGDRDQVRSVREFDDRADQHRRAAVGVEVAHEAAVDLQLVDRQRAQPRQRRVAGTEVVDREVHTHRDAAPR